MDTETVDLPEKTGEHFSPATLRKSQIKSWQAVDAIASQLRPGMTEWEATEKATQILEDLGNEKNWHKVLVRFGANTIKPFAAPSCKETVLQETDIFFVDIGPVWDDHEGDAGRTYCTGNDAQMKACATAAESIWHVVHAQWAKERISGEALYAFAVDYTASLGWILDLGLKGHRISEFPHALYRDGKLGDFSATPKPELWVLEIQIRHPEKPFGAFYEDLLTESPKAH